MPSNASDAPQPRPGVIDRMIRAAVRRVTASGPPGPYRRLAPLQARALEQTIALQEERASALRARVTAGDPDARDELAQLATEAIAELRAEVGRLARRDSALTRILATGDARWNDCTREERLDDPVLDPGMRMGIMESLDSWNDILDCYEGFFDALEPLHRLDGTTRVLDLAAGHGGFVRAAAKIASRRGQDLRFTASDLKNEYLDIGRDLALHENLPVDFVVQDALDLSNLPTDSYDIIVCTQSLHHFPPGLVTLMFEAATRAASRGVVFIDGCRSVKAAAGALIVGLVRLRNPDWLHDALISLRKCFVPAELELLARIARPEGTLESTWMRPGYCLLRWRSDAI